MWFLLLSKIDKTSDVVEIIVVEVLKGEVVNEAVVLSIAQVLEQK